MQTVFVYSLDILKDKVKMEQIQRRKIIAMIILKYMKDDEEEDRMLWKYAKTRKKISEMYRNRKNEGFFKILINSHLIDEEEKFKRYFRLTRERFAYVLNLIEEDLKISSCNRVKLPITPAEKLALTLSEEPVRQHLKNVYACLALSTVSAGVGAYIDMVSSLSFSGLLSAVVGVFLLLALNSTPDNGKNRQLRMSYLLGFSFCSGLGMGSLLDYAMMVDPKIIVTALVSTATIFVCFTMAALTARRGRWLYLGGTLMSFLSILIILSFANIFFGSQLLFQGYLYLGLLLMCGFILYDTQLIIEKRRYGNKDFILHSVDLFVDLLGIFRRLLLILTQKEQKKKSRKD